MNKLTTFSNTFIKSISDFEYYNDIVKAKFSFSIKYYYFLGFVLSLIYTALALVYIPYLLGIANDGVAYVKNSYPKDLEITIKKGSLSINQPEPYFIKLPQNPDIEKKLEKQNEIKYENILAFDRNATLKNYSDYKAFVVVSDVAMIYPKDNNIQAQSLAEILKNVDGVFDKSQFDKFIDSFFPYVKTIIYALIPVIFLGMLLYYSSNLVYLLLVSLLILVLAKIFLKSTLEYKKVFQVVLHAVTVCYLFEIVNSILGYFKYGIHFPFMFMIILTIFSLIAIKHIKSVQVVSK